MTINLSEHAGGGNTIYVPHSQNYNGSSYMQKTSVTIADGPFTMVARFRTTGTTAARIMAIQDGGGYDFSIEMQATGEVLCNCWTEAAVNISRHQSINSYNDGEFHTIFTSYDPTSGNYTFIVDGEEADDPDYVNRKELTGALLYGTATVILGQTNSSKYFDGDIGFAGYTDDYLSNWQDFMDETGSPKQLDEAGWAEWGSQPLYWHQDGLWTANQGSGADATISGTVTPVPQYIVTFPHLGLNTIGTAVASDIADGRTAWVDGIQLVGAFNPNDVPGLSLWLDASDISSMFTDAGKTTPVTSDGDSVVAWEDKSLHGAASYDMIKSSGIPAPVYKTNRVNGLAAVYGDGTSQLEGDFLSIVDQNEFNIFMVLVSRVAPSVHGRVFERYQYITSSIGMRIYAGIDTGQGIYTQVGHPTASGDFATSSVTLDVAYIHQIRGEGGTCYNTIDDAAQDTTAFNNVFGYTPSPAADQFFLYKQSAICDIAEILIYGTLSVSDRTSIHTYLKGKWGTP